MTGQKYRRLAAPLGILAVAAVACASAPASAQDFCGALKQVIEDAPNKFANIGKLDMTEMFATSGSLEIMLPGSSRCSLAKIADVVQYSCDIGGPSEAEAVAGKNHFNEQIRNCYPDAPVSGDADQARAAIKFSLPHSNATVGVQNNRDTHYGYVAITPL